MPRYRGIFYKGEMMSMYEALKDVAKLAQKADNVEVYTKLMDLQAEALSIQEKLLKKQGEIESLNEQLKELKDKQSYTYDGNHQWFKKECIDNKHFCPVCLKKNGFEHALRDDDFCLVCKMYFE